jgi:hypothetical protein
MKPLTYNREEDNVQRDQGYRPPLVEEQLMDKYGAVMK